MGVCQGKPRLRPDQAAVTAVFRVVGAGTAKVNGYYHKGARGPGPLVRRRHAGFRARATSRPRERHAGRGAAHAGEDEFGKTKYTKVRAGPPRSPRGSKRTAPASRSPPTRPAPRPSR
jgi:hypothetical protein